MGLPQRKHCLIMLQVLFLAGLASAVPAPEADPLLYTGHPLTYAVPYVTYHAPKCETEFEEVKGQSCVTKPVTECNDVEVPSHKIVTEDVCQRHHRRVHSLHLLCRCVLWQEGGRSRPSGPRWRRPCRGALPQLCQQGDGGVLPCPEG